MGCRVREMRDFAEVDDPDAAITDIAREDDKGTIGDIHPWAYWQTADREKRDTGAWSMAWGALTTGGGTGGSSGRYSRPMTPTEVQPVREKDGTYDDRFKERKPNWPSSFPSLPQGVQVILVPGTDETEQADILYHADPRLFAVHTEGPGEAGSLVCDLQPEAEPCMDKSGKPGIGGRHARLQSHLRVVALGPNSLSKLRGAAYGNGLAWNLALAGVDKLAGYGMVWAQLDGGSGGPTTGGPTIPPGPITPGSSAGRGGPAMAGMPGSSGSGGGQESVGPPPPGAAGQVEEPRNPNEFGKFEAKHIASHGVALMAHLGAYGPLHAGSGGDKHKIGNDRDGHPINSGHISTAAYYFMDANRDAPLEFERDPYPVTQPMPLKSRVHLQYDRDKKHDWIEGQKDGLWRWWAEVPYVSPPTTGTPTDPVPPRGPGVPGSPTGPGNPRNPTTGGPPTPGGPTTPGSGRGPTTGGGPQPPGGPITPGSGSGGPESGGFDGPRPQRRRLTPVYQSGTRNYVGETVPEDVSLYSILHPMQETWASWGFRPQMMVEGVESFTHNPHLPQEAYEDEDATRPMVLACDAWGAQAGSEWDYVTRPRTSRARGGTANGGILFRPPHLELEDYFGVNSAEDVTATETTSYVTLAPNVALGFGLPSTDGDLQDGSYRIRQDPAALESGLLIEQKAGGTWASPYLTDSITFTDKADNDHAVEIVGGFITSWTITPP